MPIQENCGPSEGIQPILRKILANQKVINDSIIAGGGGGASNVNLTQVGGTPVSDPLPVAIDLQGETFPITYGDTPSIDAFDRLRVSDPTGLFESTLTYDKQLLLWNEVVTGTASSTHLPNESAVRMRVLTNGDSVVRQTKDYFRYQPGKSQLIFMTFNFGAGDPNVTKRVGYFDGNNGIFLEEIDGAVWMVKRSFVSGVAVDTRIAQANWNLDTYPSFDSTKAQILIFDLEWLGVGRVRTGFVEDGIIKYVHQFVHANIDTTVYMSTAQLPLRLETTAGVGFAGTNDFLGICGSVISEGGQDDNIGFPFSVRNTALRAVGGTPLPLLSIRPKATFNSLPNRVQVIQRLFEIINQGSNSVVAYDVIYNGTLTGASWVDVDASSVIEYDLSATSIAGGIVVASGFIASTNQSKSSVQTGITGRLPLSLDIAGANPTALTIRLTNITGTGSCVGSYGWQEYR